MKPSRASCARAHLPDPQIQTRPCIFRTWHGMRERRTHSLRKDTDIGQRMAGLFHSVSPSDQSGRHPEWSDGGAPEGHNRSLTSGHHPPLRPRPISTTTRKRTLGAQPRLARRAAAAAPAAPAPSATHVSAFRCPTVDGIMNVNEEYT